MYADTSRKKLSAFSFLMYADTTETNHRVQFSQSKIFSYIRTIIEKTIGVQFSHVSRQYSQWNVIVVNKSCVRFIKNRDLKRHNPKWSVRNKVILVYFVFCIYPKETVSLGCILFGPLDLSLLEIYLTKSNSFSTTNCSNTALKNIQILCVVCYLLRCSKFELRC